MAKPSSTKAIIAVTRGEARRTVEIDAADAVFFCALAELFGPGHETFAAKLRAGASAFVYDRAGRGLRMIDLMAHLKAVKALVPMEVTPLADFLCYAVKSRSEPTPHRVDLEEYGGNGKCSCGDFAHRMEPWLARGGKGEPKYQCDHIRAARDCWMRTEWGKMMKERKKV